MSDDVVLFEKRGHVALVTLNRPEARNAFDPEVLVRLDDAWTTVREDDEIRVAVLTGTGTAFCAGADLGRLIPLFTGLRKPENEFDEKLVADPAMAGRGILRDFDTEKPVIAAINGFAIAGGMEIVMGTDIRVGATVRLPIQIPYARAMELLITGDQIEAAAALELGFVNYVVPADQVLPKAFEIAEKIAGNGPIAVKAIRASIRAAVGVPEAQGLKQESEFAMPVFASEDAQEGPRAFMEKRKPVFKGR